ncbi:MAG: DNA polymerase-4, partial [Alteromonadaceae bacterium]
KFQDFQLTTVEHRCPSLNAHYFDTLLQEAYERAKGRGIRLVGLHIGLGEAQTIHQLPLPLEGE